MISVLTGGYVAKNIIAEMLTKLLANKYALYTKTQAYHWNVIGCHFLEMHEFMQKQYEDLANSVDEIAERIRALDTVAPLGLNMMAKLSEIKDTKGLADWNEIIEDLIKDHQKICKAMYDIAKAAEKASDIVTLDMMVRRITVHEKFIWMMKSISHKTK